MVQQECSCENAVLCICPDTSKTVYVLGDLDLLCFEGRRSTTKPEDWKMTQHDPAGTVNLKMKPPEVYGMELKTHSKGPELIELNWPLLHSKN